MLSIMYIYRLEYIAKRRPILTLLANLSRGREVEPSSQTSLLLFLAAWRHPLENKGEWFQPKDLATKLCSLQ